MTNPQNRRRFLASIGSTMALGATGVATAQDQFISPVNPAVVERTAGSITLDWGLPSDGTIEKFRLYVDGQVDSEVGPNQNNAIIQGLKPETTYEVGVQTVLTNGTTSEIVTREATTRAFYSPVNPAVEDTSALRLTVDWGDPVNTNVAHFAIYLDGTQVKQVSADQTTVTVSGLEPDTSYEVGVETVLADGQSSEIVTREAATKPVFSPANPEKTDATPSSITFDWGIPSDPDLDHFAIYVDGTKVKQVGPDSSSATITGLEPDTTYTVGVDAVLTNGSKSGPSTRDMTTAPATTTGPEPVGDSTAAPTDPDDDGLYEDVNGNGRQDIADAVDLFQHRESVDSAFFDFNDSGEMEIGDAVELFRENTGS